MSTLYASAQEMVGNTPLLALPESGDCRILAKLECCNPTGSAKDRAALYLIRDGEARGLLRPGGTIIEPTSGNTGLGLASLAVQLGYRCIIVMPDSMSRERQLLTRAYGAELVLTPGNLGMAGAEEKAEALCRSIPGSFQPGQFTNPANARAHYETTGPEIWRDTGGKVDIFVAGVGTGGTITGVGRYLKAKNPDIQVVAVEPEDSPLLSQGRTGPHGIQGIGPNFLPQILDRNILDEILPVSDGDAMAAARRMGRRAGVLVGISSGAALYAAGVLAQRRENRGKTIVALCPDGGERYLSTGLFGED